MRVEFIFFLAQWALFAHRCAGIDISTTNQDLLLAASLFNGPGIVVTGAQYTGAEGASGTFTNGPFGIGSGTLLTNGLAPYAQPGTVQPSFDNSLPGSSFCTGSVDYFDATVLEVDFTLAAGFNGIQVQFIFASEDNLFADRIGIWLDGTEYTPDINSLSGYLQNTRFNIVPPDSDTSYQSSSPPLIFALPASAGAHQMVFAVCDGQDHIVDSGFLINAGGCVDCNQKLEINYVTTTTTVGPGERPYTSTIKAKGTTSGTIEIGVGTALTTETTETTFLEETITTDTTTSRDIPTVRPTRTSTSRDTTSGTASTGTTTASTQTTDTSTSERLTTDTTTTTGPGTLSTGSTTTDSTSSGSTTTDSRIVTTSTSGDLPTTTTNESTSDSDIVSVSTSGSTESVSSSFSTSSTESITQSNSISNSDDTSSSTSITTGSEISTTFPSSILDSTTTTILNSPVSTSLTSISSVDSSALTELPVDVDSTTQPSTAPVATGISSSSSVTTDQASSVTTAIGNSLVPISTTSLSSSFGSSVGSPSEVSSLTASESSDVAASTTATESFAASNVPSIDGYVYLGCLGSQPGFPTFVELASDSKMTAQRCITLAGGSRYIGLYQTSCYVSDSLDNSGFAGDGQCDLQCPGDPGTICGGDLITQRRLRRRAASPNILLSLYGIVEDTTNSLTDIPTATASNTIPSVGASSNIESPSETEATFSTASNTNPGSFVTLSRDPSVIYSESSSFHLPIDSLTADNILTSIIPKPIASQGPPYRLTNSSGLSKTAADSATIITTVVYTTVNPMDPEFMTVTEVAVTIRYPVCHRCAVQIIPPVEMTTIVESCQACGHQGENSVTLVIPKAAGFSATKEPTPQRTDWLDRPRPVMVYTEAARPELSSHLHPTLKQEWIAVSSVPLRPIQLGEASTHHHRPQSLETHSAQVPEYDTLENAFLHTSTPTARVQNTGIPGSAVFISSSLKTSPGFDLLPTSKPNQPVPGPPGRDATDSPKHINTKNTLDLVASPTIEKQFMTPGVPVVVAAGAGVVRSGLVGFVISWMILYVLWG